MAKDKLEQQDVYSYLLSFVEVGGDLGVRIDFLGIHGIFGEWYASFGDNKSDANKALWYLLHVYSVHSHYVLPGKDWMHVKSHVAKDVGILKNTELYENTVGLKDPLFTKAAYDYLEYQGFRDYRHLVMLKDLYNEFMMAASSPLMKGDSGNIDYEMKHKCIGFADDTRRRIDEYEQKISHMFSGKKDAIAEIERREKAILAGSLSVDANEYIK